MQKTNMAKISYLLTYSLKKQLENQTRKLGTLDETQTFLLVRIFERNFLFDFIATFYDIPNKAFSRCLDWLGQLIAQRVLFIAYHKCRFHSHYYYRRWCSLIWYHWWTIPYRFLLVPERWSHGHPRGLTFICTRGLNHFAFIFIEVNPDYPCSFM